MKDLILSVIFQFAMSILIGLALIARLLRKHL